MAMRCERYKVKYEDFIKGEEPLTEYRRGGYHPVSLGDCFKEDRYKVYHKLGWGRFATVWLASDDERQEWIALKIVRADSAGREVQNLKRLSEVQHRRSSLHVVQLYDTFDHQGPNGVHQCIVLQLLGPSLGPVISKSTHAGAVLLKPPEILRLSEQVLNAVSFVHSAGFAHGDINPTSILFTCTNLSKASQVECLRFLGAPACGDLSRNGRPVRRGYPTELIKTTRWPEWNGLGTEEIRLVGFGDSYLHENYRATHHIDSSDLYATAPVREPQLRLPELFFTNHHDYQSEFWLTGYMIFWITFALDLFERYEDNKKFVSAMLTFVEEIPPEWRIPWEYYKLSPEGEWASAISFTPGVLAECFRLRAKPEVQVLYPVVRDMMRLSPRQRISVEDAMQFWDRINKQDRRASAPAFY